MYTRLKGIIPYELNDFKTMKFYKDTLNELSAEIIIRSTMLCIIAKSRIHSLSGIGGNPATRQTFLIAPFVRTLSL